MRHYLDSSVVLAWLLEGNKSLRPLEGDSNTGSSRLLWVEVSRVLHRALQTNQLDPVAATEVRHNFNRLASGLIQVSMTENVLNRASGSFPLVVRTLDAIHLASAQLWGAGQDPSDLSLWTLDRQMNLCAAQMGFQTPLLELGK